jgi:hypothetical protein
MLPLSPTQQDALTAFVVSIDDIPWLAHCGDPDESAIVAGDLVDAWDGWNAEMIAAWLPQSKQLEINAARELGEPGVDIVFDTVSRAIDVNLTAAMEWYFENRSRDNTGADRGLWREWLDVMKRDLAWAAVERILIQPGFFTGLLRFYGAGRWPCAYEDGDTSKRIVLL